jgi:hypothetical protein
MLASDTEKRTLTGLPSVEIFVGYPKKKETNALVEVQAIRDSGKLIYFQTILMS